MEESHQCFQKYAWEVCQVKINYTARRNYKGGWIRVFPNHPARPKTFNYSKRTVAKSHLTRLYESSISASRLKHRLILLQRSVERSLDRKIDGCYYISGGGYRAEDNTPDPRDIHRSNGEILPSHRTMIEASEGLLPRVAILWLSLTRVVKSCLVLKLWTTIVRKPRYPQNCQRFHSLLRLANLTKPRVRSLCRRLNEFGFEPQFPVPWALPH